MRILCLYKHNFQAILSGPNTRGVHLRRGSKTFPDQYKYSSQVSLYILDVTHYLLDYIRVWYGVKEMLRGFVYVCTKQLYCRMSWYNTIIVLFLFC